MLEFVDSDLYFVKDKNNFINPLLQVGFGSGSVEKSTGSGSGWPKINGSGSSSLACKYNFLSEHYTQMSQPYTNLTKHTVCSMLEFLFVCFSPYPFRPLFLSVSSAGYGQFVLVLFF